MSEKLRGWPALERNIDRSPVNQANFNERKVLMTPLEYELRWERVWNYLMLDCAKTFKDDLCC
ncbi:MAG TPA: hypothetical protein VHZ25_16220 [Acidobacteriaceae bacterium]|nr:hypothetical protein [Acidobacteriaceae bacterium]